MRPLAQLAHACLLQQSRNWQCSLGKLHTKWYSGVLTQAAVRFPRAKCQTPAEQYGMGAYQVPLWHARILLPGAAAVQKSYNPYSGKQLVRGLTRCPSGTLTYCCQVPAPPAVGQGAATTRVPSCGTNTSCHLVTSRCPCETVLQAQGAIALVREVVTEPSKEAAAQPSKLEGAILY